MPDEQSSEDSAAELLAAATIARCYLDGKKTALRTAVEILQHVDCWHLAWDALGESRPLAGLYVAQDLADGKPDLDGGVELWHPSVRNQRQREFIEAEKQARPGVDEACHALIEYAETRMREAD